MLKMFCFIYIIKKHKHYGWDTCTNTILKKGFFILDLVFFYFWFSLYLGHQSHMTNLLQQF